MASGEAPETNSTPPARQGLLQAGGGALGIGGVDVAAPATVAPLVPWATLILIAINVGIFAVQGRPEDAMSLVAQGSLLPSAVAHGESWRLLTSAAFHIDWVHLSVNMLMLLDVGTGVEKRAGSTALVACYVAAALTGNAGSLLWSSADVFRLGASGALFGVAGASLVLSLRANSGIPGIDAARSAGGLAVFIAYNLLFGMAKAGIDNGAHVGGLAFGLLAGLACPMGLAAPNSRRALMAFATVAPVAAAALVWVVAARLPYAAERPHVTTSPVLKPEQPTAFALHPAPEPQVDPAEARRKGALDAARTLASKVDAGIVDCSELHTSARLEFEVCDELRFAVVNGRTRPGEGREVVKSYLRDKGLRRIAAYVVGRVEGTRFEVAKTAYNDYFGITYPTGKHFYVDTVATDFTTTGRFQLWVRETGREVVYLRNGGTEMWPVYRESILGQLWQAVREAPAGWETTKFTKAILKFIVFSEAFEVSMGTRLTDDQVFELLQN